MRPLIVVPYRDRFKHLQKFVPTYRSFDLCVVEQNNNLPFNRGLLLNIGYLVGADRGFTHFIFHDIDMLCVGGMSKYNTYPGNPAVLATHVQQFGYRMPFPQYFGGVTMFSAEHFKLCNGYPCDFWGWGGEDNSMYDSVLAAGLTVTQVSCYHTSLPHPRAHVMLPANHPNFIKWKRGRQAGDGLDGITFDCTIADMPDCIWVAAEFTE